MSGSFTVSGAHIGLKATTFVYEMAVHRVAFVRCAVNSHLLLKPGRTSFPCANSSGRCREEATWYLDQRRIERCNEVRKRGEIFELDEVTLAT